MRGQYTTETFIWKDDECVPVTIHHACRWNTIYFLGKQMNTKLIFDGPSVRWFGLVFQFSSYRRRRRCNSEIWLFRLAYIIFNARLFSFILACSRNRSVIDERSIGIVSSQAGQYDPIIPTFEQRYRAQSGELIEISGARSFFTMRFSLAADCFRNFPRVSRTLVNIPFLWSTTNVTFRTQRTLLVANPIELERIHFYRSVPFSIFFFL